jgi:hypothetical protein
MFYALCGCGSVTAFRAAAVLFRTKVDRLDRPHRSEKVAGATPLMFGATLH